MLEAFVEEYDCKENVEAYPDSPYYPDQVGFDYVGCRLCPKVSSVRYVSDCDV